MPSGLMTSNKPKSSLPRSTTRASKTESRRHIIAKICQQMSSGATLPDVSWVTLIVPRRCGVSAPFQTSSRIWTDWMADWIEEGAGFHYGLPTIRQPP